MSDEGDTYGNAIRDFASSMFQQVKEIILNFVEPFLPRKRISRFNSDDSDKSEEADPVSPKRIRLQDITMAEHNLPTATPTAVPKGNSNDIQFVPHLSKNHQFNFSNSSRNHSKENWRTPEKMKEFTASPSPKNKFRAPAHCRSPPRIKPINLESELNNDVQIVEVKKNFTPLRKIVIPQKNRSFTLSNRRSELVKSVPSFSSDLTSSQPCLNSEICTRLSKEEYSTLLGTFMNGNVNMEVNRVPSAQIDLTKPEQNDLAESLTLIDLTGKHPKTNRGLVRNSIIDLTKSQEKNNVETIKIHPVISLVDDEKVEEVRVKSVLKLNSLEKKIKEVPCTSPSWLTEMNTRYRKKLSALDEEKDSLQKKLAMLYERNRECLDKWQLNRIKMEDAFSEYIIPIEEEPVFPELTLEMKNKVKAALRPNPADELLVQGFGISIKRRDISTLKGLNWLNDEVINFYMNLLMDRAKNNSNLPSVYAFNTFFYPKLIKQGHSSLRRWTRKVDIFSHDLIVIPVHLQMHWCMSIIDFKQKTIKYYDSMGHPNDTCLKALLNYLVDEYKDKKNGDYETNSWALENVKGIPQQNNGSDCGVFACTFAEYVCRRAAFSFSQKEMPYFREKMVYEILSVCLMA